MIKNKKIRACIKLFDAMLANDLEPEQRVEIESCRKHVIELGRKKNPSDTEIFRCIGGIASKLFNAFRND